MMKILSWNSRGLGHPSKLAALKYLIHSENPEIVLIQETKQDQSEMSRVISQQKHFNGCASEVRGASGGILTIWDRNKWICDSTSVHQNWIRITLESKTGGSKVTVYNVYAPNQYREKEMCWNTLEASIEEEQNNNLIIAGDLNLVMHANEKRGGNFTPDPSRSRLEAIMQEHDLVDIRPKNRRYTWSNRRIGAGNIMERLDRFLISIAYLSTFSTGHSNILNVSASDHYPIMLTLHSHCQLGPIPFKYCAIWNRIPAAKDVVRQAWVQHVEGSPNYIWETKLKRVRQALKNWARNNYQEPEKNKKKIKQDLEEVQQRIEVLGLSQQAKEQESRLYSQLSQTIRDEETKWRLKSRQLWLQEGDKNTSYFHKQATV